MDKTARIVECVFSAPLIDTAIALLLELRGKNLWHRMLSFPQPMEFDNCGLSLRSKIKDQIKIEALC